MWVFFASFALFAVREFLLKPACALIMVNGEILWTRYASG
jgi:hypothetical protein